MEPKTNGATTSWLDSSAGKKIQELLSEERTLNAIEHLLARIDTLEKGVSALTNIMEMAPGYVAMVGDMADDVIREADSHGISVDERMRNALYMMEKLTAPEMVEKFDSLMTLADQMPGIVAMTMDMADEGMASAVEKGFDLKTVGEIAGAATTALTLAKSESPAKVGGIFGLLRVLKDPDRQRGLGFLMNFIKHFGRNV